MYGFQVVYQNVIVTYTLLVMSQDIRQTGTLNFGKKAKFFLVPSIFGE